MTIPSEAWREEFGKRFRPLWNIAFTKNETVTMPVEIVDWVSALDIIEAFIAKVRQEAHEEGRKAAVEAIESALSRIKHRSYIEALPDNGEDNGKPEKVVTYENVRVVFNDLLDDLSTENEEGEEV